MAMLMLQGGAGGCVQRSYRSVPRSWLCESPKLNLRSPGWLAEIDPSRPFYKNDAGRREIAVSTAEFACIGQSPPHDHPRVFLKLGSAESISCPYCSTRFRLNPRTPMS
jgi:uncharacterized Zn-finger protein